MNSKWSIEFVGQNIITTTFKYADTHLPYPVRFHLLAHQEGIEQVYSDDFLEVLAFPLAHRVKCYAYVFQEKPKKRRIVGERLPLGVTSDQIYALKKGEDIAIGGKVYANAAITLQPKPSRSYAYCTDTSYLPSIVPYIKGVDVLYYDAGLLRKIQ